MNSFELNKILGAVLFIGLCTLALNITAGAIFAPVHPEKPGYAIAVKATPGAHEPDKKEPEKPIAVLLASSSVDKGQVAAKKCQACHTFEKGGPNKVGPNLWNIVGDARGENRGGFDFSSAMKKKGGTWTYEDLNHFLKSPREFVPGTKMAFAGIKRDSERADVINYLHTLSDNPKPLPKVAEAPAAAAAAPEQKPAAAPAPAQAQPPAAAPSAEPQKPAAAPAGEPAKH